MEVSAFAGQAVAIVVVVIVVATVAILILGMARRTCEGQARAGQVQGQSRRRGGAATGHLIMLLGFI